MMAGGTVMTRVTLTLLWVLDGLTEWRRRVCLVALLLLLMLMLMLKLLLLLV